MNILPLLLESRYKKNRTEIRSLGRSLSKRAKKPMIYKEGKTSLIAVVIDYNILRKAESKTAESQMFGTAHRFNGKI